MIHANDDATEMLPVPTDPAYEALFEELALSPVQRRFAEQYVLLGKVATAARVARPGTRAPSGKAQHEAGQALLRQPAVQTAIARLQAYYSAKIGIQTERLLGALKAQAFLDPLDAFDEGQEWKLRPLEEWPLEVRQCLKSVKTRTIERTDRQGNCTVTTEVDVEFPDRQEAIRLLGMHLGLWDKPKGGGGYTLIIQPQDSAATPPVPKSVNHGLVIDLPPEDSPPA